MGRWGVKIHILSDIFLEKTPMLNKKLYGSKMKYFEAFDVQAVLNGPIILMILGKLSRIML